MTIVIAMTAVCMVSGVCTLGIFQAFVLPVRRATAAANAPHPVNSLHQIALALQNYHDEYGVFPPAVVTDASGKPLYSGRVLLLPFLEEEALFQQFDKDQAWDSQQNLPLSQASAKAFQNPLGLNPPPGQTDFLFVTGTSTVFETGKAIRMADIIDGLSNTIVVVEIDASGVNWAEPRDLDLSQPAPLPPGTNAGGNHVAFADGSVRLAPKTLTPQQIREMATRNGKEPKIEF